MSTLRIGGTALCKVIAVNEDGYREVLGAAEGMKEDKSSWVSFFQWLRSRGLDGVKLLTGGVLWAVWFSWEKLWNMMHTLIP